MPKKKSKVRRLARHATHQKYYLQDGTLVPGASTIAGINKPVDPLIWWAVDLTKKGKDWKKERNLTADYGTIAHFLIDCHLAGDTPDLCEFTEEEVLVAQVAFDKFLKFWADHNLKAVAMEKMLVSNSLRFGGALDLVARMGKELVLFDWKTSKSIYPSHIMQAVGYKYLWDNQDLPEDTLPDMPIDKIDRVCIVRVGRDSKNLEYATHWVPPEDVPLYWDCFNKRLGVYYADLKIR